MVWFRKFKWWQTFKLARARDALETVPRFTHEAETIDEAIVGAVEKLKRSMAHTLGRLSDR